MPESSAPRELRGLRALLVECLRLEPGPLAVQGLRELPVEQMDELIALAVRQKVAPLLWHRMRGRGLEEALPPDACGKLKSLCQRTAVQHLGRLADLGEIAAGPRVEQLLQHEDDVALAKWLGKMVPSFQPGKHLTDLARENPPTPLNLPIVARKRDPLANGSKPLRQKPLEDMNALRGLQQPPDAPEMVRARDRRAESVKKPREELAQAALRLSAARDVGTSS